MSRLKKLFTGRIRLAVLAIAVLAAIFAAYTPAPSQAQTRCGTEFIYYSDDTFTEVVGVRGWLPDYCGCQFYSWGCITSYREVTDSYC
jgi:hypothetical protein